jgi:hypothetical protein
MELVTKENQNQWHASPELDIRYIQLAGIHPSVPKNWVQPLVSGVYTLSAVVYRT